MRKRAPLLMVVAAVIATIAMPHLWRSRQRGPYRRRLVEKGGEVSTDAQRSETEQVEPHLEERFSAMEERLSAIEEHLSAIEDTLASAQGSDEHAADDLENLSVDVNDSAHMMFGNFSAEDLEINFASWQWSTWVFAVFLCVVCAGCQGFCVWCVCCGADKSFCSDIDDRFCGFCFGTNYEPLARSQGDVGKSIRFEMRLMMLYPLLGVIAMPWADCGNGVPWWAYAVYFCLLLRSKILEFRLLSAPAFSDAFDKVGKFALTAGFVLGCLEHMDWFTDGIFPMQTALCDPAVTAKFAASFEQSWVWPLAPIVRALRFWGVLLVVFMAAALSQQLAGSGNGDGNAAAAADAAGWCAVAAYYEKGSDEGQAWAKKLMTLVCKVFLENLAQLWLQSSYYAIALETLDDIARLQILISIGLGLLSATLKAAMAIWFALTTLTTGDVPAGAILMLLAPPILIFVMVAWVVAKLSFAHVCPSHMWNITSGCVVFGH